MSELKERLKMDMELRGYSRGSIKTYTNHATFMSFLVNMLELSKC